MATTGKTIKVSGNEIRLEDVGKDDILMVAHDEVGNYVKLTFNRAEFKSLSKVMYAFAKRNKS